MRCVIGCDELVITLVESRLLLQDCLTHTLEGALSCTVNTYPSVGRALESLAQQNSDLIILSSGGADKRALDDLRSLVMASDGTPVVFVSSNEHLALVPEVLSLGARGYIPTSFGFAAFGSALMYVHAGGLFAPVEYIVAASGAAKQIELPNLYNDTHSIEDDKSKRSAPLPATAKQAGGQQGATQQATKELTERELLVARELRLGKSNKVIAFELGISESTVKVHIRNIMKKLSASNRTQAALMVDELSRAPAA